MSDLAALLLALHGPEAGPRFRTAYLVAHVERAPRALDDAAAAVGWIPEPGGEAESRPEVEIATVRCWFEPPLRLREERTGDQRWRLVQDGPTWWFVAEDGSVHLGEDADDELHPHAGADMLPVLEPLLLLGLLQLVPRGRGRVAGREALLAAGTPRVGAPVHVLDELVPGADAYDLAVDAELGVVLRLEARRDGALLQRVEVREARFDEPIPDEVFRYEPLPGTVVGRAATRPPPDSRLAASMLPFAVWVPPDRPGWTTTVDLHPGLDPGPDEPPPAFFITLRGPDEAEVTIREWAATEAADPWSDSDARDHWEPVPGADPHLRVCAPRRAWKPLRVRLDRGPTRIEVVSYTVAAGELVALAESLERIGPDEA